MRRIAAAVALLFLLSGSVLAEGYSAPDEGQRAAIKEWFRTLRVPVDVGHFRQGTGCCDEADCKVRNVEQRFDGMYAWIEEAVTYDAASGVVGYGQWVVVPPQTEILDEAILNSRPFFKWVVCYVPGSGNICSVRPTSGG